MPNEANKGIDQSRKEFASIPLIKILKLRSLRKSLGLVPEKSLVQKQSRPSHIRLASWKNSSNIPLTTFKVILKKTDLLISNLGGKLYFVYLPSGESIASNKLNRWRKFSLDTATELGIPIIDIYADVFSIHPDPLSLFPYRREWAHYNAKGYSLIVETIADRLRVDGLIQ